MMVSVPVVAIGVVALLALFLSCQALRKISSLRKALETLQQETMEAKEEPEVKARFADDLSQVEQTMARPENTVSQSEKYRYVASLANQGVDAQGIADALQLAPAEVAQLMQLARLKKQVEDVEH